MSMHREMSLITACLKLTWVVILRVANAQSFNHTQRYFPFSPTVFDSFTAPWTESHSNWIGIDTFPTYCPPATSVSYPVCVDRKILSNHLDREIIDITDINGCPRVQCLRQGRTIIPAAVGRAAPGTTTASNAASSTTIESTCTYTPPDTVDYLPPPLISTLDNSTICRPPATDSAVSGADYGMDQGLPPHYLPLTAVRMNISGTVSAQIDDRCTPIINARILAWQIDPRALATFDLLEQRAGMSSTPLSSDKAAYNSLREMSCSAAQTTLTNDGAYSFETLVPPSYGPPRHIMFTISAPGYQTVTTRVYFDNDWRLQQLTTLRGEEDSRVVIEGSEGSSRSGGGSSLTSRRNYGFSTEGDFAEPQFPGAVAKDPRVAHLHFVPNPEQPSNIPSGSVAGRFVSKYNFVLQPLRSSRSGTGSLGMGGEQGLSDITGHTQGNTDKPRVGRLSSLPAIVPPALEVDGLWADAASGGLVKVETSGNTFVATEYPHMRKWGTVIGYIAGNTIRGVDFGLHSLVSFSEAGGSIDLSGEFKASSVNKFFYPSNVWTTGYTSGIIVPFDAFETAPAGGFTNEEGGLESDTLTIRWNAAGSLPEGATSRVWRKVSEDREVGYRYIKLTVSRETSGDVSGKLVINELDFFEGVLAQTNYPSPAFKMTTPRYPVPQRVTCSSFLDQPHHCYRAFDGDDSSSSAWVTKSVGSLRHILSQPQWVVFDFGPGRGIKPTAMRIVCDAGNPSHPAFCPRTFSLSGSFDNVRYEIIYKHDFKEYSNQYAFPDSSVAAGGLDPQEKQARRGQMFYFVYEAAVGRRNGQQCGSCQSGPKFACNIEAFDATCQSRYCNREGLCDTTPPCRAGEYMDVAFESYKTPSFTCKQCAAGRYGSSAGIVGSECSGLCAAGYYCPAGSTSPTEFECGDVRVYCPPGSGAPIEAAAGRKTMPHPSHFSSTAQFGEYALGDSDTGKTNAYEELCSRGHYCTGGVEIPCPLGRYGATAGMRDAQCTDDCTAGFYCPPGAVAPTICNPGHYCSNGNIRRTCPAGTYGAAEGLRDVRCSGLCAPGHYCEAGSISSTSAKCPVGRYGSVAGLQNHSCSGECAPGHYCPAGSTRAEMLSCGRVDLYCPMGSATPNGVDSGFYTVNDLEPVAVAPGVSPFVKPVSAAGSSLFHPAAFVAAADPEMRRTRSAQRICEKGFYCVHGLRFACPAGTFGNETGLSDFSALAAVPVTILPTFSPTFEPTPENYTYPPTAEPTVFPSRIPSASPSTQPSSIPSLRPTPLFFTLSPSLEPTTIAPTPDPSPPPTWTPSAMPTTMPTIAPSAMPTAVPFVNANSSSNGFAPSYAPTAPPTFIHPTSQPTYLMPSSSPTGSVLRTSRPTYAPTISEQLIERIITCSGYCAMGHYCPENSTSRTQFPCPAGRYGAETGLKDAACTGICPLGHYCVEGSVLPVKCPAGSFGNSTGLTNAGCATTSASLTTVRSSVDGSACWENGGAGALTTLGDGRGLCSENPPVQNPCFAGYYCPEGSIQGDQLECGGADVFCPEGSALPVSVSAGYYTVNSLASALQKAGGGIISPTSSSSILTSTGRRQLQSAASGEDSIFGNPLTRVGQRICEEGYYCVGGIRRSCPAGRYGSEKGLQSAACSGACSAGYYCPIQTANATMHRCPAGRYGATAGLSNSACTGICQAGYHCPEGSSSPTQLQCGLLSSFTSPVDAELLCNTSVSTSFLSPLSAVPMVLPTPAMGVQPYLSSYETNTRRTVVPITAGGPFVRCTTAIRYPNGVFCPEGSSHPIKIFPGYYTVGGANSTTRTVQLPCPVGSYCPETGSNAGLVLQCPAGRYGRAERLISPACTGACARGYYCPAGSERSTQEPCPIGRYGASEGLSDALCTGPCRNPLSCPLGSTQNA